MIRVYLATLWSSSEYTDIIFRDESTGRVLWLTTTGFTQWDDTLREDWVKDIEDDGNYYIELGIDSEEDV